MNSLSGLSSAPRSFDYATDFKAGSQTFAYVPNTTPWLVASPVSDDDRKQRRSPGKRSKKSKKHRTKSHRKRSKHRIGAYILQLIGFICLVLAAIKSFEPLTGVGFTLILIGYNKSSEKVALASKSSNLETYPRKTAHAGTDISENRKEKGTKDGKTKKERDHGIVEVKGQNLEMENEWVRSFESLSIRP